MTECCSHLALLKKEYEVLRKKYNLPSFKEMNEDFELEKLQERETETLAREIRRLMNEKNSAYLKFIEMFMNPSSSPMFIMALIKGIDSEGRNLLEELYSHIGRFEIISINLDNIYDEKKEADYIKKFFNEWQLIKPKFEKILKSVETSIDKKYEKSSKGYLG